MSRDLKFNALVQYHPRWLIIFGVFDLLYVWLVSGLYFDMIALGTWWLNGGYHSQNGCTISRLWKRNANTYFDTILYSNITTFTIRDRDIEFICQVNIQYQTLHNIQWQAAREAFLSMLAAYDSQNQHEILSGSSFRFHMLFRYMLFRA